MKALLIGDPFSAPGLERVKMNVVPKAVANVDDG
jgi:hypothetical protein